MTLPPNRAAWPAKYQELWAERAGIMQFQANMTRDAAEWRAEQDIRKQAAQAGKERGVTV